MTETAIAATTPAAPLPATPLAVFLGSAAAPPELSAYRGALTPHLLDAPGREIEALTGSAAVHDLGWLRRVAVHGEDRFRWLSGMVTNAVNELEENTGAWNLVLNAQGRIQGDLHVWRDADQLELEIAAHQVEKLMAHLDRFIIMDDVELVPLSGETALGLTGPLADEVLGRAGLPVLAEPMSSTRVEWNGYDLRVVRGYGVLAAHYELWTPLPGLERLWKTLRSTGAAHAGSASVDALRIAEGIPAYGIDMLERDLAQETSQMRTLSFNKGC
jgi:folate-binding Fe-S cluster repair protein YgfZ